MMNAHFDYGHKVRVIRTIRNDTYGQTFRKGEKLVPAGSTGFVRHVGMYLLDQLIYQVHFLEHNLVIGCRDSELQDAALPWNAHQYERGDKVTLTLSLRSEHHLIAQTGDPVTIVSVDNSKPSIRYRVVVADKEYWLPERALTSEVQP